MQHIGLIALLVALIPILWATFNYLSIRKAEWGRGSFDTFHGLIEKLVLPQPDRGDLDLDVQRAAVYELRNYPAYYDFTERTLSGIRSAWNQEKHARLIQESDLTLRYIRAQRRSRMLGSVLFALIGLIVLVLLVVAVYRLGSFGI